MSRGVDCFGLSGCFVVRIRGKNGKGKVWRFIINPIYGKKITLSEKALENVKSNDKNKHVAA